jgi:xanthine dehydrogenase accessory factor
MQRAVLDALLAARAAKRPVALVTNTDNGRQALLDGDQVIGDLTLGSVILDRVREAIAGDRSGPLADTSLFVQVHNPPLRMVVVGAVHIAQTLVPMATLAGYDVTVIDPRQAWATDARFPDVALSTAWPDEALTALRPDRRTAVVTLTHDPKLDDPALLIALKSEAFYIGALGSKRTHAKRLDRLRAQGLDDERLARIHGPAGLALGAKSPAEIAVSIVAQATQALHATPAPAPVAAS